MRQPDRDGDAFLILNILRKPGQLQGRDSARSKHPAEVQKGLVDRERLNVAGQGAEVFSYGHAGLAVFGHIGLNDHRLRAKLPGFEHGHGRANTLNPRKVARRGHNAALPTADNHRAVTDRRVVTLFNGRVEGIAVDVGEGEGGQLRVPDHAGTATGAATVLTGPRRVEGQAAAAQAMVGAGVQGSGLLSCGRFLLMLPWGEKRKGAAAALAPPLSGSFECRSRLTSSSIL